MSSIKKDRGDKPSLIILEELANLKFEDFQEELKKYEFYKEDILLYLKHKANKLQMELDLNKSKKD
jgi:hypothetical protein